MWIRSSFQTPQGAGGPDAALSGSKSSIGPVPEMVSVPVSSEKDHDTVSPHVPEDGRSAANDDIGMNPNTNSRQSPNDSIRLFISKFLLIKIFRWLPRGSVAFNVQKSQRKSNRFAKLTRKP